MERNIIAINGTIGSGKDAFAQAFVDVGYQRVSFAKNLKDAVSAIFGWDREMLEGNTPESRIQREIPDTFWCQKLGRDDVSPRWVLQNYGTDVMRKYFHDNIWVFSLEYDMMQMEGDIIITDCRFPNELKMIRDNNGVVIEIQRTVPYWYGLAVSYNTGAVTMMPVELESVHRSEWAWIGINSPNHTVLNDGTLKDLYRKAETIIHELRG